MLILSVMVAFLLLGVLWLAAVLHEHGLKPLRRLAELMKRPAAEIALVALVAVGLIHHGATKTNVNCKMENVKLGDAPMIAPGSTETGILHFTLYTLHSHTNSDWLAFGGYEDWFPVDEGGWCFRFGSNLVERLTVFSCGEISPAPYDASNRISLLGLPLSIAPAANWHLLSPQQSLFCHSETPSNTLLLTWQNALVNRDTNLPVTVQAELFPDGGAAFRYDFSGIGDISALSNAEAQIWRDGVAETGALMTGAVTLVEFAAPAIAGTNALDEVYARIAGGNTNAYYCADVVVSKGPAKIRVEPLGVETNRGLLGAYEIVAMPGETNRLPLLIGPKYTVTAESAFGAFELVPPPFVPLADDTGTVERLSFSDAFSATNVTDRLVEVSWPVACWLRAIDATPETATYALRVTPDWLGGTLTWHGIDDTNAPPMRGTPPMRSGGSSCSCGCLSRDGDDLIHSLTCGCEHCDAEGEYGYEGHSKVVSFDMKDIGNGGGGTSGDEGGDDNPPLESPWVTVSFDKGVVIFEDEYENSPGVTVPRRSKRVKLTLTAHGGDFGCAFTYQAPNEEYMLRVGGGSPPPTYVSADFDIEWTAYYEGIKASTQMDDLHAMVTYTDPISGKVYHPQVNVTVVEVSLRPKVVIGNCTNRHNLGVCEKVECRQTPNEPEITWTAWGGYFDDDIIRGGAEKVYNCPLYADSDMLEASVGDVSYTPLLTVVQPQGVTTGAVQKLSFEPHPNQAGFVGMQIELYVLPQTVSFAYTKIEEVPSDQGTHSGYFGNPGLSRWWYHTTGNGAGVWNNVGTNNYFMVDHAKMAEEMYQIQPEGMEPLGWIDGSIEWHVPYGWKAKSEYVLQPLGGTFATNIRQTFHITTNGTVSIEKHGNVISRGTNDVVTLNGVIQNGQ